MLAGWSRPKNKPYRYHIADRYVYERVSRARFRRVHPENVEDVPVHVLGHEVMVRVPGTYVYIKTHKCVLEVRCPWCGAKPGEFCDGVRGPVSYVHKARRDAWKNPIAPTELDALIEHLLWIDDALVIERVVRRGVLGEVTRRHRAAARRLRLYGQFHPEFDSKVVPTIQEFRRTGTSSEAEEWKKKYPVLAGALTMCVVDGIGPRRALVLLREGYENFDALVVAAKTGKFDKRGRLAAAVRKAAAKRLGR